MDTESDNANPADAEGRGASELVRPEKPRGDLRLLRRAILRGWQIPEEIYVTLPKVVVNILTNATTAREKLAAIKLLTTMHKDNVDTYSVADRTERLDEGQATEIVELLPIRLQARD
jgi:pyruvate dehydrogenase complex dehydrogenase (E1) component